MQERAAVKLVSHEFLYTNSSVYMEVGITYLKEQNHAYNNAGEHQGDKYVASWCYLNNPVSSLVRWDFFINDDRVVLKVLESMYEVLED